MNTEYTIIPICIPDNDDEFIKVSNIVFNIYERDDDTGRLIDTMKEENNILEKAKQLYGWAGKIDFVYGIGTAGGIGSKTEADKANKRIINTLSRSTRKEYWQRGAG